MLDSLRLDGVIALRRLRQVPGFTLVAVATLVPRARSRRAACRAALPPSTSSSGPMPCVPSSRPPASRRLAPAAPGSQAKQKQACHGRLAQEPGKDPSAMITAFVPDLAGTYVIQLVVNEELLDGAPSTTQVQVVEHATAAIEATQDVQEAIATLNPAVFKNANMQRSLNNKLNAVIADIEAGDYASALDKLEHDIVPKSDGCATSGTPDNNDWIRDCAAQALVYPLILEVMEILRGL